MCVHQSVCLFVCCMVHLSFSQTLFPSTELAGCCIDVHKANAPSECAWRCSASPPHFWKYLCRNLSRSSQCEGHMTPTMFLKGMSHWHAAMGIKLSYILWGFAKDGRRRCTADIFFLTACHLLSIPPTQRQFVLLKPLLSRDSKHLVWRHTLI